MKIHEIDSNGRKFVFNVIKNTTTPCPHCGVPACGKEDILWYEHENQRMSIVFDGGYFDLAKEEFFNNTAQNIPYNSLPTFMKQWNELIGWEDCWDYNGYELQIDDFLRSMELLRSCETGKWITKENIDNLQELARTAQKLGAKLKIVRG
jgi:hypothetical protein